MSKNKHYPLLAALVCSAALTVAPAEAKVPAGSPGHSEPGAVACEGSTRITGNAAYAGQCLGALKGDISRNENSTAVFDTESGEVRFDFFDKQNGHGRTEGMLELGQAIYGMFVLGIKVGETYSLYLFDGDDEGVDRIEFDTMGAGARGNGDPGVMTHAFLFTPLGVLPLRPDETPPQSPNEQQLPEPASSALTLAALGAAGLAGRRRRR
jgi:PEP-CTERM motif